MRKKLFGTRRRKIVALVVGIMMIASAAYAAWIVTGSGDFKGKTGTFQTLAVGAPPTLVADLFPGTTGDVQANIVNPNPAPLTLSSVTWAVSGITSSDQTNCPASNFTSINKTGLSIPLAASATTSVTIPDALSMAANAPNGCQGGITITVQASSFSATT